MGAEYGLFFSWPDALVRLAGGDCRTLFRPHFCRCLWAFTVEWLLRKNAQLTANFGATFHVLDSH